MNSVGSGSNQKLSLKKTLTETGTKKRFMVNGLTDMFILKNITTCQGYSGYGHHMDTARSGLWLISLSCLSFLPQVSDAVENVDSEDNFKQVEERHKHTTDRLAGHSSFVWTLSAYLSQLASTHFLWEAANPSREAWSERWHKYWNKWTVSWKEFEIFKR